MPCAELAAPGRPLPGWLSRLGSFPIGAILMALETGGGGKMDASPADWLPAAWLTAPRVGEWLRACTRPLSVGLPNWSQVPAKDALRG